MAAEIVELHPETVGEGYRFDPDKILEAAKGQDFERLLLIGSYDDGTLYIAGSANAGEMMILMELAKHQIVFGE